MLENFVRGTMKWAAHHTELLVLPCSASILKFIILNPLLQRFPGKWNSDFGLTSSSVKVHAFPFSACLMVVEKNVTHRHGSLSVGSCGFEKLVVAFGAGSSECMLFSTCIPGADFVIKIILNEVCQWRRRLQRGECIVASFLNQHREW